MRPQQKQDQKQLPNNNIKGNNNERKLLKEEAVVVVQKDNNKNNTNNTSTSFIILFKWEYYSRCSSFPTKNSNSSALGASYLNVPRVPAARSASYSNDVDDDSTAAALSLQHRVFDDFLFESHDIADKQNE